MAIKKISVVDLFAGAGGFSLAAIRAGADIVFAVESDPHAAATYKNNIVKEGRSENAVVYNEDIRDLSAGALASEYFSDNRPCDLLIGGPPCQGFSTHRIKSAGVGDPRNQLLLEYFEFVVELRPRAFLVENVPGMLWPRHKSYLDEFYQLAAQHGYHLFPPVKVDARDYGTPQRRHRVFLLGVRGDVDREDFVWPPPRTHSSTGDENGDGLKPWAPCTTAFDAAPPGDKNDVHMNHGPELTAVFANTPKEGGSRAQSGRTLKCHLGHNGHKDVYGRIDSRKPAPTMTTACINPSKGRFVHPRRNHGITVRQAARIQAFPDDYVFEGGLISAGKQVGNAVPITLGEALIGQVMSLLNAACLRRTKCRR